jgi:hypothetical protein
MNFEFPGGLSQPGPRAPVAADTFLPFPHTQTGARM